MTELEFQKELEKLNYNYDPVMLITESILIDDGFGRNHFVEITNGELTKTKNTMSSAISEIIKSAIDMDEWKHSMHNEIMPKNYEVFKDIIEKKAIGRLLELDMLLTVHNQICNYDKKSNSLLTVHTWKKEES